MSTGSDLRTASGDELLATIAQPQGVIGQLQIQIAALEARLKPGGPPRMPGNKLGSGRRSAEEKNGPRKLRPHGFARQRMAPTHRLEHVLETCPDCSTGLAGGWVQRTREVVEVPVVPVEVTEHVFVARTCPVCEGRRMPKGALEGMALGRQRLGVNLVSLILTLREEGRMPFRTIQWYLRTVDQLHLSVGGIVQVIHRAAQQARLAVAQVLERNPSQPGGASRRNRLAPERGQRV